MHLWADVPCFTLKTYHFPFAIQVLRVWVGFYLSFSHVFHVNLNRHIFAIELDNDGVIDALEILSEILASLFAGSTLVVPSSWYFPYSLMQGPQYTLPQLLHSRGSLARFWHSMQANSFEMSGVFESDMSIPGDALILEILYDYCNLIMFSLQFLDQKLVRVFQNKLVLDYFQIVWISLSYWLLFHRCPC